MKKINWWKIKCFLLNKNVKSWNNCINHKWQHFSWEFKEIVTNNSNTGKETLKNSFNVIATSLLTFSTNKTQKQNAQCNSVITWSQKTLMKLKTTTEPISHILLTYENSKTVILTKLRINQNHDLTRVCITKVCIQILISLNDSAHLTKEYFLSWDRQKPEIQN